MCNKVDLLARLQRIVPVRTGMIDYDYCRRWLVFFAFPFPAPGTSIRYQTITYNTADRTSKKIQYYAATIYCARVIRLLDSDAHIYQSLKRGK